MIMTTIVMLHLSRTMLAINVVRHQIDAISTIIDYTASKYRYALSVITMIIAISPLTSIMPT